LGRQVSLSQERYPKHIPTTQVFPSRAVDLAVIAIM